MGCSNCNDMKTNLVTCTGCSNLKTKGSWNYYCNLDRKIIDNHYELRNCEYYNVPYSEFVKLGLGDGATVVDSYKVSTQIDSIMDDMDAMEVELVSAVDFLKDWNDMCGKTHCNSNCSLYNGNGLCRMFAVQYPEEAVRAVLDWKAEHFITNKEKLIELGAADEILAILDEEWLSKEYKED